MSPDLPTVNVTSQEPSTKAWLLLLSMLTGLLLAGSRAQVPAHGAAPTALASSRAHGALPASRPLPEGRRVALKSPTQPLTLFSL